MADKFAYVSVYGPEKALKIVPMENIFALSNDGKKRVPYDAQLKQDRLVVEEGDKLTRIHILLKANTKKAIAEKLAQCKKDGVRFSIPPRKSVGPTTFPLVAIQCNEEATASKNKLAQEKKAKISSATDRNQKILHQLKEGKIPNSFKPPGASTPSKTTSKTEKNAFIKVENEVPCCIDKSVQTDVDVEAEKLKVENDELQKKVTALQQDKMQMQTMHDNLQKLCDAMLSSNNGTPRKTASNIKCKINDLKSLVDEEPTCEVPPDMVYVGSGKVIDKKEMAHTESLKTYKARLSAAAKAILGDPHKWSLTGKNDTSKISNIQVEAIHSYLNALRWKNITLRPIKCGKQQFEPLTAEYIRRTLSKHLSEIEIMNEDKKTGGEDDGKNGKLQKRKATVDKKRGKEESARNEERQKGTDSDDSPPRNRKHKKLTLNSSVDEDNLDNSLDKTQDSVISLPSVDLDNDSNVSD